MNFIVNDDTILEKCSISQIQPLELGLGEGAGGCLVFGLLVVLYPRVCVHVFIGHMYFQMLMRALFERPLGRKRKYRKL